MLAVNFAEKIFGGKDNSKGGIARQSEEERAFF
jgi:hypothetical protein